MRTSYQDIIDLTSTPPLWFDEAGVPRYCSFAPSESANIYAGAVALARINCSSCGQEFTVCISSTQSQELLRSVEAGKVSYGDPPNTGCCPSGATLTSRTVAVTEVWVAERFRWRRHELPV
jgi:hypothetical protein